MNSSTATNRRTFLQCLGAASLGSGLASAKPSEPAYAYVGSFGPAEGDGIEVFRVDGKRWKRVQRVSSRAPAALLLHPSGRLLYAVNQVAVHEGLPQGTLEAFSIDRQSGELSLLHRQALSLSGTEPRSLAMTPDARFLLVAVYGGGAYNVLPIEQDGKLGPVRRIFKELGCGQHCEYQATAHPHSVVFDSQARLALASDFGCDQLSVFAVDQNGDLQRRSKVSVPSGAGPGSMVLHPCGATLYALHELNPAISCHRYVRHEGVITDAFQHVPLSGTGPVHGGLAIDSKGRFLYSASGSVWGVDPLSGRLSFIQNCERADALHIASDDRTLHAVDRKSGSVMRISVNVRTGKWDEMTRVASVSAPASLAFLNC